MLSATSPVSGFVLKSDMNMDEEDRSGVSMGLWLLVYNCVTEDGRKKKEATPKKMAVETKSEESCIFSW
eukprot:JP436289.1.p3 GENE.JP436289.1~~JP436289.1.p3  ORF type:complete len:69 (-),score=7.07 JP436289.1:306-512(-)